MHQPQSVGMQSLGGAEWDRIAHAACVELTAKSWGATHQQVQAHFLQVACLVLQHVPQQAVVKLRELLSQRGQLGSLLRCRPLASQSAARAMWAASGSIRQHLCSCSYSCCSCCWWAADGRAVQGAAWRTLMCISGIAKGPAPALRSGSPPASFCAAVCRGTGAGLGWGAEAAGSSCDWESLAASASCSASSACTPSHVKPGQAKRSVRSTCPYSYAC